MKLSYGASKSRSCRVVQDSSSPPAEEEAAERCCCWAELPEELLREVLVRIESSQTDWPLRKNVVACAGVCKTWRCIMKKELVKFPEVSGILTFPISIKQVYIITIIFGISKTCFLILIVCCVCFIRFDIMFCSLVRENLLFVVL